MSAAGSECKVKISPEELLRSGRSVQLQPTGWSMYPMFVPGRDWAVLTPVAECLQPGAASSPEIRSVASLHRGEIALFRRREGILVMHRIDRVAADGFWFVGDNLPDIEKGIEPDQILGVLTGFVRKGKAHGTGELTYRVLSRVWLFLRPLRPAIHTVSRFFRRRPVKR